MELFDCNFVSLLKFGLRQMMMYGNDVTVRGYNTKELLNVSLVCHNPLERVYVLPARNDNIFAKIAETLWTLAGRDDIQWLSDRYLPRAPEFSDDGGYTWRGAYGPRLRNWKQGSDIVDQVKYVANLLQRDRTSRQGVMSIWRPDVDTLPGKDIPCNNWIHAYVREGRLNLNVAQRSSDVLWGYSGIDTFLWSVLQQMLAYWVGVEVGEMTHFISSWHVYERHYKRANDILERANNTDVYQQGAQILSFNTPLDKLDGQLEDIFEMESEMRWNVDVSDQIKSIQDPFLRSCAAMLNVYWAHLYDTWDKNIERMLQEMPPSDFKLAALEYLTRDDRIRLDHFPLEQSMLGAVGF